MNTKLEDFKSTLNPMEKTIPDDECAMFNDLTISDPISLSVKQILSARRLVSSFVITPADVGNIFYFHNTPWNTLKYFPDVYGMFNFIRYDLQLTFLVRSPMHQQGKFCVIKSDAYVVDVESVNYSVGELKGCKALTPTTLISDRDVVNFDGKFYQFGSNADFTIDLPWKCPHKMVKLVSAIPRLDSMIFYSMGTVQLKISYPIETKPEANNIVSVQVYAELKNVELAGWCGGQAMLDPTL